MRGCSIGTKLPASTPGALDDHLTVDTAYFDTRARLSNSCVKIEICAWHKWMANEAQRKRAWKIGFCHPFRHGMKSTSNKKALQSLPFLINRRARNFVPNWSSFQWDQFLPIQANLILTTHDPVREDYNIQDRDQHSRCWLEWCGLCERKKSVGSYLRSLKQRLYFYQNGSKHKEAYVGTPDAGTPALGDLLYNNLQWLVPCSKKLETMVPEAKRESMIRLLRAASHWWPEDLWHSD